MRRWNIDRYSADSLSHYWPTIDRLSTDYRPTIDGLSTDYRPTVDRLSTDCRPLYRLLCRPLCWPISSSTLPRVNKIQGDNIRHSCPSIVQVFGHAWCKGRGKNLYDPDEKEKFSEVHAPGLFKEIFQTILNDDKLSSSKRCNLQRIRVVTLLHNSASLEIRYGPLFFETNTMIKLLACTTIEFNHIEG